jgi:predicted nucleic acid-binding protein
MEGIFYPEETKDEELLAYYSRHLNSVEIYEWAINEGIAAVDRKLRRGEITVAECDGIIREILRATRDLALTTNLILMPVESALVSSSAKLITKRHLSADDSLQLFSALAAEADMFISADSRLNEAASSEGIRSFDIEARRHALWT